MTTNRSTSPLLRASLGSPTYDGMRETLRTRLYETAVEVRGVRVAARCLPLLKHAPDGDGLLQVVRVSAASEVPLSVELDAGQGAAPVRAELPAGGGADLLVPAVESDRDAVLTVCDAAGTVLGTGTVRITPQRRWTVHLVHHSHLDIGYTDRQGDVLRNHALYLDTALDLAEATADRSPDARFRWTVESAYPVGRWLAGRPAADRERFARLARAGQIDVTAFPFQMHTEAASTEELHRLLRLTDRMREEHGIPVRSAMHTDVPGAVAGVVDALAASGVRYLSVAHNWAGRAVPYLAGGQDLGRPFWWRAASGERVLVWFTNTAHGMAYMEGNILGLAEGYDSSLDLLPNYLDSLAHKPFPYGAESFGWSGMDEADVHLKPYPFDVLHLRVQGGPADNAGPSPVPADVAKRWNETWAWPRVLSSSNTGFFEDAEQRIGDAVPEHRGDWTDWWVDGIGSGARALGYARAGQNTVRQAETVQALAGEDGADPAEIDAVHDTLGLFDEHTWGAANPWHNCETGFDAGELMWSRKRELAHDGADTADDLLAEGGRRLGARHAKAPDAAASWLVVNTGPAVRSDLAEFFLPASTLPLAEPFRIRDARTGAFLPHDEEVFEPEEYPTVPYGRRIRVAVPQVPTVGWVRLDAVPGGTAPAVEDLGRATTSIENEHYRVEFDLDEAVISSVFDKAAGRDLVNKDAYAGMNQYVYEKYGTAPRVNHLSGHIEAGPDLALLAGRSLARRASVVAAERTPVAERLVVEMDGEGTRGIRTEIELKRGVRRVDIANRIRKEGDPAKESVFFAFPLAVREAPQAWELTGAVGGSGEPVVPGSAPHVTPLRHWLAAADGELAVGWAALEAPLAMIGDIHLPYVPYPATLRRAAEEPATVYSWALNNIWDTNFPDQQQGDMTFRYALSSEQAGADGADPRELGPRTAAGLTDPLVAVPLTGSRSGAELPSAEGVFAVVDHPQVHISTLGRARHGDALVVRLRSVAAEDAEVAVRLPDRPAAARVGTSLEHGLTDVPVDPAPDGGATVRVPVPAGALVTLRLG